MFELFRSKDFLVNSTLYVCLAAVFSVFNAATTGLESQSSKDGVLMILILLSVHFLTGLLKYSLGSIRKIAYVFNDYSLRVRCFLQYILIHIYTIFFLISWVVVSVIFSREVFGFPDLSYVIYSTLMLFLLWDMAVSHIAVKDASMFKADSEIFTLYNKFIEGSPIHTSLAVLLFIFGVKNYIVRLEFFIIILMVLFFNIIYKVFLYYYFHVKDRHCTV